jgi:DNA modification methylase
LNSQLVYEDSLVRLFVGDARHIPIDDNSAGQIITSPPYNCRARYDGYDDWLPWDEYWNDLIVPFLRESIRVLVPGGRLCVNFANVIRKNVPDGQSSPPDWKLKGHWRWTPPGANGEDWAALIDEHFFPTVRQIEGALPRERLTWVKGDKANEVTTTSTAWGSWMRASNPVLRATSEPIYIVDKLTHKRPPGTTNITAEEFKAWTRNTWFVPVRGLVTGKDANPSQFPLEIPRRLMKLYGYVEDLVVDPFAGECTTLVAAKRLGRKAVGVEQGTNQCRRGADRCRQDVLFDEGAA